MEREAGWYWLREKHPLAGNGLEIGYFSGVMWIRAYSDDWEGPEEINSRFTIGPRIEEPEDE